MSSGDYYASTSINSLPHARAGCTDRLQYDGGLDDREGSYSELAVSNNESNYQFVERPHPRRSPLPHVDAAAPPPSSSSRPSLPPLPTTNPYRNQQQRQSSQQQSHQSYPSEAYWTTGARIEERYEDQNSSQRGANGYGLRGGSVASTTSSASSIGLLGLYDRSPASLHELAGEEYFPVPLSDSPPTDAAQRSPYDTPSQPPLPASLTSPLQPSSSSRQSPFPSTSILPSISSFRRVGSSSLNRPGLPTKPDQYKHAQYSDGFYSPGQPPYRDRSTTITQSPPISPPLAVDYAHRPRTSSMEHHSPVSSISSNSGYSGKPSSSPSMRTAPPRTSARQGSISSTNSALTYSSSGRSVATVTRQDSSHLSPKASSSRLGSSNSQTTTTSESGLPEFMNPALLSNIAVYLKDTIKRRTNSKGAVEYPASFTGHDIVSTIQAALPTIDREYALEIGRTLQRSLWFEEVDWDTRVLRDSAERVYVFPSDAVDELEERNVIPTAVLTQVARCYSSFCGRLDEEGILYACYAFSCPNNKANGIRRQASLLSTSELIEEPGDWASSVAPSVLETLSKDEVQRQSLMFELIQGEQNYLNDLDLIEKGFVEPLRSSQPPIIAPDQMDSFLSSILLNISDIREHSRAFLNALLARQKQQYPCLAGIGDIIFRSAVEWGPAYTEFTVNFPFAESKYKLEKKWNLPFEEFVNNFTRLPEAKRQSFEHFQTRSTFRAVRYLLLLEQILKKTDDSDKDRDNLLQAISVISSQSKEANEGIAETKSKLACSEYHADIFYKPGDTFSLELMDPLRRHFTASKVYRRPEGSGFTEWNEAHLVLFDHYLVVTKPARTERDGRAKYLISRRPVPLELIVLRSSSFSDPPVPRSSGFHLRGAFTESAPASINQDTGALAYPVTFRQLGRNNGTVTYYVDSATIRAEWEKKLKEACALRKKHVEANPVVRLQVISDTTFGATSFGSLTPQAPASSQFGRPTCSIPLTSLDGQQLIAIGSPEGLFIGHRGRSTMRQVLHLPDITQCAVLQEFGFFLVVAGRILIAYPIEALIPSRKAAASGDTTSKAPQKLSGQKDVLFFRVGKVGDAANPRTLVIYVKRSGVKESVFKALEPVHANDRSNASGRFLGFGGKSESFKTYKDFFIPSSSYSIQFLRSKLAIICAKGIEIMSMETLLTMSVPDFSGFRNDAASVALAKRCEEAKTLGMFRLQDNEFLLCYDDFAFLVDKHGEPLPDRYSSIISWESHPESVAYQFDLIFAFSPTMIEIRHARSGRLAQVIVGNGICMTYDGTGIDASVNEDGMENIHFSQRVGSFHCVYEIVSLR